jgi:hypothetical protein
MLSNSGSFFMFLPVINDRERGKIIDVAILDAVTRNEESENFEVRNN